MTSSQPSARARAKQESRAKRDRQGDKLTTEKLMADGVGRRWIWQRLAEGQVFALGPVTDPYKMSYHQGQRAAALRLLADVNKFTPNEYVLMVRENTGVDVTPEEEEDDNA